MSLLRTPAWYHIRQGSNHTYTAMYCYFGMSDLTFGTKEHFSTHPAKSNARFHFGAQFQMWSEGVVSCTTYSWVHSEEDRRIMNGTKGAVVKRLGG
eukprot:2284709-Rhodomonas_salina.4